VSLLGFLKPIVYARLEPELLSLREVRSGTMVSEPPVAAIREERVLAVGNAAHLQGGNVVNPFKHPRTLVADFTVAQAVLKGFMRKLFAGRWFAPSPLLVLHPRAIPEGGFTQIEIAALRELGVGAGAYKVVVWQGRDLADEELLAGDFKGI
jgi:rod shape-determining protein MreB and related proteins